VTLADVAWDDPVDEAVVALVTSAAEEIEAAGRAGTRSEVLALHKRYLTPRPAGRRETNLVITGTDRAPSYDQIRGYVLRRDEHVCQVCGDAALEVDHIWPRELGGNDDTSNLQAICGPCNKAKGSRVDIGAAGAADLGAAIFALADRLETALQDFSEFVQDVAYCAPVELRAVAHMQASQRILMLRNSVEYQRRLLADLVEEATA
jgi:hypothetical protein